MLHYDKHVDIESQITFAQLHELIFLTSFFPPCIYSLLGLSEGDFSLLALHCIALLLTTAIPVSSHCKISKVLAASQGRSGGYCSFFFHLRLAVNAFCEERWNIFNVL